jgi:preprotein translocase subunit SecB
MTDDTPSQAAQTDQAQGEPTGLPPLIINMQYVKDLSFENPNAPQSLVPSAGSPAVEIAVDVAVTPLDDQVFEVVLSMTSTAKHGDKPAFLIEIAYAGVFSVNGVPEEHLRPILLIEAPRLLFPFARAIVANVTREGGFPPLMIQPIDFVELYRRQIAVAAA